VIQETREDAVGIFTDGSMDEEGQVGGGWQVEGVGEGMEGAGVAAAVWDGEVVGVRGMLKLAPADRKFLVLSDSQAAIAAVRKAGRTGRARAAELKEVVELIRERQARLGPNAVRFAWVKAHIGTWATSSLTS